MSNMPIFCDVCECALDYRHDYSHYSKFKACRHCAMKWAEPHRSKWEEGWRPHSSDIDKYRSERIELSLNSKRVKR